MPEEELWFFALDIYRVCFFLLSPLGTEQDGALHGGRRHRSLKNNDIALCTARMLAIKTPCIIGLSVNTL
jgi:hypothetical protein